MFLIVLFGAFLNAAFFCAIPGQKEARLFKGGVKNPCGACRGPRPISGKMHENLGGGNSNIFYVHPELWGR